MPPFEKDFLALLHENRQKILRVCRVYARTAHDREDLYQEVLLQMWRALPGLKKREHANTWLYRIALNTAISFVRRSTTAGRRRVPVAPDHIEQAMERRQTNASSPNSQVDALYEAIKELDQLEKALITLFLEEMSYEEIAEILGLSVSHVGVKLHRAKKKLFQSMKKGEASS